MTQTQIIVASLRHRKLRTILLTSSIAMAIAVVAFTSAAVRRIKVAAEEITTPAVLVIGVSNASLPLRYVDQIAKIPGVNGKIEYYRAFSVKNTDGFEILVWAASDGYAWTFPKSILDVAPDVAAVWKADRQGLIVSPRVMKKMNWKVGQQVTLPPAPGGIIIEGRISGELAGDADPLIMHYEHYLQLTKGTSVVRRMVVPCDPSACGQLPDLIDSTFENASDATDTLSQKDFYDLISSSVSAVPEMLINIGILLVFVTIVVTMSTINTSLRERAAAIGTMRVLGFSRLRVLYILTAEAVVLAVLAGCIGAFVPFLLFHTNGIKMGGIVLSDVRIALVDAGLAFGVACAFGLIVGLPPALLSIRRDILRLLEG